jgi:hypothetical protein
MRLTHYSGSFKEMNNQSTVELSSKNKQNLVLNDSYDTVRGFKNEYTGKNLDEIVYRDKYKKVGSLNAEYFDKWKDVVAGIQEFKQLFEIKRTNDNSVKNDDGITVLKRNSLLQERDGTFASYPVTDGSIKYSALANNNTGPTYTAISTNGVDGPQIWTDPVYPGPGNANPAAGSWPSQSGQPWGPGGAGKSISTQNGEWKLDENKDKLKELIEASLPELTEIENELGIGGSEIIQITKHKMETIGMLMNDFGSIRLDNIGKLVNNEVLVDSTSVYMNKVDSPLLEYVHVQDLPGGNYTLNVCNRYNVMVGAGGLNLKSYGAVNLTGTITNIAGEQVNIASENEVNIDAGTINISADILRLRNKRQRQILIENSLGVNQNVIIGGGLHVEGETYLQHITAPVEYQKTEATIAYSKSVTGLKIGQVTVNWTDPAGSATFDVLGTGAVENSIAGYAHSHVFPNLPLTLLGSNSDVRSAASGLNNTARDVAEPQHNEGK